jgi:hypothetical protein
VHRPRPSQCLQQSGHRTTARFFSRALLCVWPSLYLVRALEARCRPTIEDKKPTPAQSRSRRVPNSCSPPAYHADAPFYIPGAKTMIPAALVTCEHICDWT